jgi:DNA-binding NarL/FixJ family response regulator
MGISENRVAKARLKDGSAHARMPSDAPPRWPEPRQPPRASLLTGHETRLLEYVAAGWTSAQIGETLCRSEKTVRNQLTCVYAKLGAANRAEAVSIWLRRA